MVSLQDATSPPGEMAYCYIPIYSALFHMPTSYIQAPQIKKFQIGLLTDAKCYYYNVH